ncbi:MAG: hypothetical protein QCI38_04115 [Candidatus Thermoplasmatota archaeon]|nr:hypothetical protein [Candidatus Thermoplasmatota archaeon]
MKDEKNVCTEELYSRLYKEIVKRIGATTTSTITRMKEEDFQEYEPREAIDRLVVPMVGLFGKRMMKTVLVTSLTGMYEGEKVEEISEELLA